MMQCLADGYFIVPHTVTDYLSQVEDHPNSGGAAFDEAEAAVRDKLERLLAVGGKTPATVFHRELGDLMLDRCGITRDGDGLRDAIGKVRAIREEFWRDVRVTDGETELNQALEYAGRVADFLELAELMCRDALDRDESCGCHLREEHQSEEGEPRARRRAVCSRLRLGAPGRGRPSTRSFAKGWPSTTSSRSRGATGELHAARLATGRPGLAGASSRLTRWMRSTPTRPSSRCSTSSTTA